MKKPSTPSAPRSPANAQERPVAAWQVPQPGDVLSYAYLWSHEADAGREEGSKDRPTVVVVAKMEADGDVQLLVAPITHSEPLQAQRAIELPRVVKRDLGLDNERSWIMISEMNRFVWPGPDVRIVAKSGDPYYGAIPDGLFIQLRDSIVALASKNRIRMIKRTE